jgi:hypothetical protein
MALSDDTEITIDRAIIPKDQKKIPTTRWDTLAKQQSFTMPKVPSRSRLDDTIVEDAATESSPPRGGPGRRLGGDGDGDEGTVRRGMVKQASLSSLPPRPTNFDFQMVRQTSSLTCLPRQSSFNSLTKDEQMKMPRLVKQRSLLSLRRGLCDEDQSIGIRPCMDKQNSCSLPNRPCRPHQSCVSSPGPEPNHIPKLPVRTDDSDETTDTLSSMPRLIKQTSFTVATLSSRGPLMGDDEKGGNGTDERRSSPEQNHIPKLPVRTDDRDETTDTLSSMPRLIKHTSFTVAGLSSRGPLMGDDEKGGNGTDERRSSHHSEEIKLGRKIATSLGGNNPYHYFL